MKQIILNVEKQGTRKWKSKLTIYRHRRPFEQAALEKPTIPKLEWRLRWICFLLNPRIGSRWWRMVILVIFSVIFSIIRPFRRFVLSSQEPYLLEITDFKNKKHTFRERKQRGNFWTSKVCLEKGLAGRKKGAKVLDWGKWKDPALVLVRS